MLFDILRLNPSPLHNRIKLRYMFNAEAFFAKPGTSSCVAFSLQNTALAMTLLMLNSEEFNSVHVAKYIHTSNLLLKKNKEREKEKYF